MGWGNIKYMYENWLRGDGNREWSDSVILCVARIHTVVRAALNAYTVVLGYALVP